MLSASLCLPSNAPSNLADTTANHTISYGYDHLGRMTSQGDSGHSYTYTFDALDRLDSRTVGIVDLADTVSFDYDYDVAGRLEQVDAAIGSTSDYRNQYAYDNLHRLQQITQQANGGHAVAEKRVDFAYDIASQIDTITRYSDVAGTTAVATTNYDFDKAGRLDFIKHHDGGNTSGTLIAGYDYTFDRRNRLDYIDFLHSSTEDVDYSYDNRDQLVGAVFGDTDNNETYAYDDNGNRDTANQSKTHNIHPNPNIHPNIHPTFKPADFSI